MQDAFYPWPLEEVIGRPLGTLLLALLVPLATARLFALTVPARADDVPVATRAGSLVLLGIEAALAMIAGLTGVGPAWEPTPSDSTTAPAMWLARITLATVAAALTVGIGVSSSPVSHRPRPTQVLLDLRSGVGRRGALVGLGLGLTLAVGVWLADQLTRLPVDEAELASPEVAWRRLRVDPGDASATLALGWQARRREDLERAEAYAAEAERLSVARPQLLELLAELQAARGDCTRARALFDEALEARVVDPLAIRIELGGYRIPPTLLTECGMGETGRER